MKCTKCQAEISAEQKFCAECGTQAPEAMTKACVNGHDVLAKANFCGECGEELHEADDLDAGIAAIETMAKAATGTKDELELDPGDLDADDEDEDGAGDGKKKPLIKSDVELPDGVEGLDAEPLIKGFVDAHRGLNARVNALGRMVAAGRRDIGGMMLKAVLPLLREVKALRAEVKAQGDKRQPRKAITTPLRKSLAGGDPETEDDSLRGGPLLKCAMAAEKEGAINGEELSVVESLVNGGASFHQLTEAYPALGGKLAAHLPSERGH